MKENNPLPFLQTGIVKQLDGDPENEFRILVTVPALDDASVWARLGSPHASLGGGICFFPEIGDDVILGFINNNRENPVILGSLNSKLRPPAVKPSPENDTKTILTKSRLQLSMNDAEKSITIRTPSGNTITLSDEAKSIAITDANANSVIMNSAGIQLNSAKDITIAATGEIRFQSAGKISLDAQQDVSLKGMNITNNAQVKFEAKGNAEAELAASGQTVVRGAIVMIN